MLEGQRSYIDRVLQGPQREQCIPGTQAGQVSPTHPLFTYSRKHFFLNSLVDSFFFFFLAVTVLLSTKRTVYVHWSTIINLD